MEPCRSGAHALRARPRWWRRPGSNRRPPGCEPGVLPLHHVALLVGLVGVEPIVGRVSDGCTHTVVLQPSGGPGRTRTAIGRVQAGCSPLELQARVVDRAGLEPATSTMPSWRAPACAIGPAWCTRMESNHPAPRCRRGACHRCATGTVAPEPGIEPRPTAYKAVARPSSYTGRNGDLDGS